MGCDVKALKLDPFLSELQEVDALEKIQDLIQELRETLATDHVIYHWGSADGEQYGYGTYEPIWVQHYIDQEGVSETLCMRVSPCGFDGSFVEPFLI